MIKSYTNPSTPRAFTFPRLMVSKKGAVVLFHSATSGLVVGKGPDSMHKVGFYCTNWAPATNVDTWSDYTGSITLENDL